MALRNRVEPAAGTTVIEINREAPRVKMIVRLMGMISSRTVPEVNTIGKNTHTVVSVEAMIAPATCFVPWTAARAAPTPLDRKR